MDKISITFISQGDKRYAVFHVKDAWFNAQAYWANYHGLPRDGDRVELQPGDEERIIAEVKEKIAEAKEAIARYEEFLRPPAETREIDVCGHKVAVHFQPWQHFHYIAKVSIPAAMKDELEWPDLLSRWLEEWEEEENGTLSLTGNVKDKDEYFNQVQAEMSRATARINEVRAWRSQPTQRYEWPGNVRVVMKAGSRPPFYDVTFIAPKTLIEKATQYGLALAKHQWWPTDNSQVSMTWTLKDKEVELSLATLRKLVEDAATTKAEVVAQYSV